MRSNLVISALGLVLVSSALLTACSTATPTSVVAPKADETQTVLDPDNPTEPQSFGEATD